ncbi:hypothetical protein KOR34_21250 [Posidoniimonas corsicana]|uniref:Uncharacterized protein n=1 Tax=Posidoniimonas corsicana TaxID=1938618 RepID=A0A5C5VEW3_9BACT|nr:hypothetical protein [Posidoniimonas corsicana]TWT37178.1 hypothetical protein KOR34_21250 [Posidoniimonas corsicana]
MARKKTTTKKTSRTKPDKPGSPSELLPTPPPSEDAVTLSVDIPTKTSFRLKVALLHMEARGSKVAKKQFVQQALVDALDRFDQEWGGRDG